MPEDTRNMEIINLLLGKDGIDVNLHPELKSPPLLTAIQWRLVEAVESLFARDDLDLADRRQSMPNVRLVQSQGNRKVGTGLGTYNPQVAPKRLDDAEITTYLVKQRCWTCRGSAAPVTT